MDSSALTVSKVTTEGAEIKYWYKGEGPLIIFIPGAGGEGIRFQRAILELSDRFTVAAYDRRCNAGSTGDKNSVVNIGQQSRDTIAVIKALGFEKAYIFGTSAGGVVALEIAAHFPQNVAALIAHEAPTMAILEDAQKLFDFHIETYNKYLESGPKPAMAMFASILKGVQELPMAPSDDASGFDYFLSHEYMFFPTYTPDLNRIKDHMANGLKIAVCSGRDSADALYARTTFRHKEIIGCLHTTFPTHHFSYIAQPKEFAVALVDTLRQLGEKV